MSALWMPWKANGYLFLYEKIKERFTRVLTPLVWLLSRAGIHPNIITVLGLVLSLAAGVIYSTGSFFWAAWVVVLAGCCDIMDGRLARRTGKASKLGAFVDSTLDRYSDFFVLSGLAWLFAGGGHLWGSKSEEVSSFYSPLTILIIVAAMAGSQMVSYTRARAEGIGIDCKVGFMQRPERITLLVVGSLIASIPGIGIPAIKGTLAVLALLSNITAIQRIMFIKNRLIG